MLQKTSQDNSSNTVFWNALNTFINPAAGVSGSSNIWRPTWFSPSSNDNANKLMFKALALSATVGGTAFLAKAVYNKQNEDSRKSKEQLVADSVEASNPVISPDADLNDLEEESKLRGRGVMKEAQFDRTLGDVALEGLADAGKYVTGKIMSGAGQAGTGLSGMTDKALNSASSMLGGAFNTAGSTVKGALAPETSSDPYTLVIPAVATLLAAGGSMYAANKLDMAQRKKDIAVRLATARNEMDALNQAKLLIARGIRPPNIKQLISKSNIRKEAQSLGETKNFLWAVLALTGAGAGALGYMATKEYMDSRDPRRAKKKLMDAELSKMELSQGMGTPQVSLNLDPETAAMLDSHTGGSLSRRLVTRPTTGSINIEASPAGAPKQRDLLAL